MSLIEKIIMNLILEIRKSLFYINVFPAAHYCISIKIILGMNQ